MLDSELVRKKFAIYKEHLRLMLEKGFKFEVEAICGDGDGKVDLL